jgi:hypothetical protein
VKKKKKKIKPHDNNGHSAIRGVLGIQNIIDYSQCIGFTILIEFLFSFIVSKCVNSINELFVIRIVITIQLLQMT